MIALVLAMAVSAEPTKMCTVPCKPKVIKKAVQKQAVKTVEKPVCCQAPVTVVVQQSQTQTQEALPKTNAWVWEPSMIGIGARGAFGMTTCTPYVFGLLGVRIKSEILHLGLDLNTNFAYGMGASLLAYPWIGPTTSWHVNAGVLAFGQRTFANGSVPRNWDLTFGTGLEIRLPIRWLSLTADYRYAVANPWALAAEVPNGLNRNAAWGNALLRSQLMLGLMAHTW